MLEIKNLSVKGKKGTDILRNVSLSLADGKRLCLTGASGSGKTTLIKTIMGVQNSGLEVTCGEILVDGKNLLNLSEKERRKLCGKVFGFIPQNPMISFFPHKKISAQMTETFMLHMHIGKKEAELLAEESLKKVNLMDTRRILSSYPGMLSGGMLQRIAMALILGTKPDYIFADEPTSALDEKNRNLLLEQLKAYDGKGLLFVSHDVEAMQWLCPDTLVMENGQLIESQLTSALFETPKELWTKRFVHAANQRRKGDDLHWTALKSTG